MRTVDSLLGSIGIRKLSFRHPSAAEPLLNLGLSCASTGTKRQTNSVTSESQRGNHSKNKPSAPLRTEIILSFIEASCMQTQLTGFNSVSDCR